MFCKKCNDKIYHYVLKGICKNCIQKNRKEWNQKYKKENSQKVSKNIKKYQLNHPEKYKEVVNKSNKKVREKLTKSYVASSLCISVKEMSNELYEHHKSLIFFKREIIKKFGINIQKLV
jgi:esterase/lipase